MKWAQITGAAGRIGSHTNETFLTAELKARVVDTFNTW